MCRSLGCPKRVTPRTEERGGLGQPSPLRAGTEFLLQGSAGMGQGRGALTPTHGLGWPETRETQHFSHCPERGQGRLEGFTRSFPHQLCTQTPNTSQWTRLCQSDKKVNEDEEGTPRGELGGCGHLWRGLWQTPTFSRDWMELFLCASRLRYCPSPSSFSGR